MSAQPATLLQLSGLEHLQRLMQNQQGTGGIGQTLGMHLSHVESGLAVFESTPDERHYNLIGTAHGGYIATLLDAACGGAVQTMLKPGQTCTTIELKVSYHRPVTVQTGLLRAEGRIVSLGRRVGFVEAKLLDATGRLQASATSTLLIMDI